ncbi:hypothetical protein AB0N21_36375 [Streptomyces sp. NPDC051080]|uniref:hypothetical protein n=1 Tax=Streptomyces sp. NPDC051080 TaxID=3157222 RepID=UPI003433FDA4
MTSSTWPVDTLQGASAGVARQYSGTPGKVGNCRAGVGVHAAPAEIERLTRAGEMTGRVAAQVTAGADAPSDLCSGWIG